jgi:FkbM family methyltransferase
MVDIARHDDVHVFGFEPSMNCVTAITKTMAYNQRNNFNIFQNLVGEDEAMVAFSEGKADGSASIYTSTNSSEKVQQIKLDSVKELSALPEGMPTVIMIDVEGYEPNVLRGGAALIKRLKPLVLFEYNYVSKRYFNINEIHQILGDSYIIFRLRNDALLDSVVANAWNCVAIPRNTQFETILKSRITS